MNWIKLGFSILLVGGFIASPACLATTSSATAVFVTRIDQDDLKRWQKKWGSPEDFTVLFYTLVLANEILDQKDDYQLKIANIFFTVDLYKGYENAYQINKELQDRTKEIGCLDFRVLAGGNDTVNGFQVKQAWTQGKYTVVPVNGGIKALVLLKTNAGWRVDDLVYTWEKARGPVRKIKSSLRSQLIYCNKQSISSQNKN
ncbi:Uncharacterised protein [Legionella donaldsonii]|uniref:Periplasmic protein n=1 Tax=Legionella donaldsonii TaxID=45060 RepID=A0A378J048_9GAMM|nr:hypothetical protein [Legionella donaldsonii]STX40955.1 Uncharacterised protein [Legionella donaldsonii]